MRLSFPSTFAGLALASAVSLAMLGAPSAAGAVERADWPQVTETARGQTVYWHAWAGDPKVNAYIQWVAGRVRDDYGIDLRHVKVPDIAQTVSIVLAERTAGRTEGGSVDLMWINGENFAAMKANDLLYGPFAAALPNFDLVDTEGKPTTLIDFTVPTDGLESPWGMAQLVFYYDSDYVEAPPRSAAALLAWAQDNPGRFTYPGPPDFTGSTFLKQVLIEMVEDPALLQRPAEEADFEAVTAPMWDYIDRLHPHLWRGGQVFPANYSALRQLVNDGELDIGFSFNPFEASAAVLEGLLPDTVRSYVFDGGTIGNTHFVAIPFNARAKEAAMVVANFLLTPEAQARKANPEVWGDPTVLNIDALAEADRQLFEDLPLPPAAPDPQALGDTLLEPHPSWMTRIEEGWLRRYAS